MYQPADRHKDDWALVQKFLAGQAGVLEVLIKRYESTLRRKLIRRGATPAEAEELAANLWSDCLTSGETRGSWLEKYTGQTSLQSWLLTIATRRLIDWKRSRRFTVPAEGPDRGDDQAYRLLDHASVEPEPRTEDSLLDLLHHSLRQALDRCSSEDLLMLWLVHVHGLTQREIGQMWGWHETKVSRCLNQTKRQIQQETLRQMKQSDPWLHLTWKDFVDLCETRQLGFW